MRGGVASRASDGGEFKNYCGGVQLHAAIFFRIFAEYNDIIVISTERSNESSQSLFRDVSHAVDMTNTRVGNTNKI